ncbi:hypothetical protein AQPE_3184 [Aquipluma nitroreducens]|uniref:Uncharacterized protein n=1 Tax=Aquipluma nitroreducens TaxID=2010828 RepID=A0A5K7SBP6_9BACT|nr:hypothetical protein AQPE_3184 [Aquipluma nitroreducens]
MSKVSSLYVKSKFQDRRPPPNPLHKRGLKKPVLECFLISYWLFLIRY